jgi:hypothetical protein
MQGSWYPRIRETIQLKKFFFSDVAGSGNALGLLRKKSAKRIFFIPSMTSDR